MLQSDIEIAIDHRTESGAVDYKASFDIASASDWVELVKDIVAFANFGGGVIIIGISDDGTLSGFDCAALTRLDPAIVTDKVYKYTGQHFHEFSFYEIARKNQLLFAISIGPTRDPIVFEKPGTYDIGNGKQKTAFSAGTVYFRHGAKSEPGNSDDLRTFIETRIEELRKVWFEGIAKVVEAPPGSEVQIVTPVSAREATAVRLVDDPSAPIYRQLSVDETHPFRQKDVAEEVTKSGVFPNGKVIPYHIQCVRQVHAIDSNPTFCYKMRHVSARYSRAFVDWIVEKLKQNSDFFEDAKRAVKEGRVKST